LLSDISVAGTVDAHGDLTSVQSIASMTDYGGVYVSTNFQNATSTSAGRSSASASNVGILKRRKRTNTPISGRRFRPHVFEEILNIP